MNVPRNRPLYGTDLAYIHDVGFSEFSSGVAPGVLHQLRQAKIHTGLVLDLGCGSGVWAQHLIRAGLDVRGLDVSPAMIQLARRRCPGGDFVVGSVWDYRFPRCRAVTALGEVFCYRADPRQAGDRLRVLLKRIHRALEPGGLLVFDLAEVGLDRRRRIAVVEQPDWTCLVRYEYDSQRDQLKRLITTFRRVGRLYRRATEQHVVQLYDGQQVAGWLREIGFRVRTVRRFGDYALLPRRIGFVARKASADLRLR